MKKHTYILGVVIGLTLAASVASADLTVYTGTEYDVVITDPVDVGLPNPGGENLIGFMLKIHNKTGDPYMDPSGFDGVTGTRLGLYTDEPDGKGFHHQYIDTTPTLDQEIAGTDTATTIDSHFIVLGSQMLFFTPPSEDYHSPVVPSVEPPDATGPLAPLATVAFGDRLYGDFALLGGAPADIDGDGDPTTWELAWLVVPVDTTIYMNFFATGYFSPDVIVGSFVAVPEPATLFVMGCGAIGLLRRRRRA